MSTNNSNNFNSDPLASLAEAFVASQKPVKKKNSAQPGAALPIVGRVGDHETRKNLRQLEQDANYQLKKQQSIEWNRKIELQKLAKKATS